MKHLITAFIALVLLSACSSPTKEVVYNEQVKVSEYLIGAGDVLFISVWKNPDLSLNVPVRPDGNISVPLVGDEIAEGLTADQLSKNLAQKLSKYIRLPQVTVIVTEANSSAFLTRVRISGAVNVPQSVPYRRGMTVLDLVLLAGGVTPFANADQATLYRKTPKGTASYRVRIDDILKEGQMTTNYELRPSDILIVPESIF